MTSVLIPGVRGRRSIVEEAVIARGRVIWVDGRRQDDVPAGVFGNIVRDMAYERRR